MFGFFRLIIIGAFLTLLGACSFTETLADRAEGLIERYCVAPELERNALRARFSTDKGPLVQINCENLESVNEPPVPLTSK